MKKLVTLLVLMGILIGFTMPFQQVLAGGTVVSPPAAQDDQKPEGEGTTRTGQSLQDLGFDPSTVRNLPTLGIEGEKDPVRVIDSVLLNYIVNPIFFLAGGTAVIVIMYSSFRIVVARGEEEGITAAKNALIWAFAGLALVVLSYTIVRNLIQIVISQL